jgi:hypothetical protein
MSREFLRAKETLEHSGDKARAADLKRIPQSQGDP